MRGKTLSQADFSPRIRAVEALLAVAGGKDDFHDLTKIAEELDDLSAGYEASAVANSYGALAGLLRIVDTLVVWKNAVLQAEPDADRFLRSAKERYKLWRSEYERLLQGNGLLEASSGIASLTTLEQTAQVAQAISAIPLPVGIFAAEYRKWIQKKTEETSEQPIIEDLSVAFLKFHIDGQPAGSVHHIMPHEVHDLQIEVRVSRWPESKSKLQLMPLSVEPKSSYEFPVFVFERPDSDPPYIIGQRGRAVLLTSQNLHARPFEFKYTAEFLPRESEQPIAIVGHRTLMIEGIDLNKTRLCGYSVLDNHLLQIREKLRRRPGVPTDEIADTLSLLVPLCNLAGRAVQDAEFPDPLSEAEFQTRVRAHLRAVPSIGSELDEHAHATGGITDLSLRGIPLELKVESAGAVSIDDCEKYLAQAASYAVGKGKRTAVLCILNYGPQKMAPREPASLLEVREYMEAGVAVCVLVIQGGLAKPSSLSR